MADPAPALTLGEALAYGLIQGVTEFLPVSSSGHLALAHQLGLGRLSEELELPFFVLLHTATLLAIAVAFRRPIAAACRWNPRLHLCLLVSVVPAGLGGLLGKSAVEAVGDSWWALGGCYLLTAALLTAAERISVRRRADEDAPSAAEPSSPSAEQQLAAVGPRQALWVGVLQIFALLPGVSRSGATIAGGLLGGLAPAAAVSYAFLVGLPLMAAAAAKDALDGGFSALANDVGLLPLAVAFGAALGSGLASIWALKLVVGRRRLVWFAAYCALVATACWVTAAMG